MTAGGSNIGWFGGSDYGVGEADAPGGGEAVALECMPTVLTYGVL